MDTSNQTIVHAVVVGSQLHGLAGPDSDIDIRGIFMTNLQDVLSPFTKEKNMTWAEGDEDHTSYELRSFCKLATSGNPTVVETLFSDQVRETTPIGQELVKNRQKFLDSKHIYSAARGYAKNQFNKMDLTTPTARTPKYAVAYIRSMMQAMQMLKTGSYAGWLGDDGLMRTTLLEMKFGWESSRHVPQAVSLFMGMEDHLNEIYEQNKDRFTVDFDWIERFLVRTYIASDIKGATHEPDMFARTSHGVIKGGVNDY